MPEKLKSMMLDKLEPLAGYEFDSIVEDSFAEEREEWDISKT